MKKGIQAAQKLSDSYTLCKDDRLCSDTCFSVFHCDLFSKEAMRVEAQHNRCVEQELIHWWMNLSRSCFEQLEQILTFLHNSASCYLFSRTWSTQLLSQLQRRKRISYGTTKPSGKTLIRWGLPIHVDFILNQQESETVRRVHCTARGKDLRYSQSLQSSVKNMWRRALWRG